MLGKRWWKAATYSAMTVSPTPVEEMSRKPTAPLLTSFIRLSASIIWLRMLTAYWRNSDPAKVRETPCLLRLNSWTPSSASSLAIWLVRAGWEMKYCLATREKFSAWVRETK